MTFAKETNVHFGMEELRFYEDEGLNLQKDERYFQFQDFAL
jgi:hypothetical protein